MSPSRVIRRADENGSAGLNGRVDIERRGKVLIRSKDKDVGYESLDKIGIRYATEKGSGIIGGCCCSVGTSSSSASS